MKFQLRPLSLVLSTVVLISLASDAAQSAGAEPVRGPFWSGTVRGKNPHEVMAIKGIVVILGAERKAYVCYDTDLMRLALAWTGDFLEFGNTLTRIEWPPPPPVKGDPAFGTGFGPGWAKDGNFTDPRPDRQGPLPKDWAHYRGLYVHGDDVILSYTVGDCDVLELPGVESSSSGAVFTRFIRMGKTSLPLTLLVCETEGASQSAMKTGNASDSIAVLTSHVKANDSTLAAGVRGAPEGATWESANGRIVLKIPALTQPTTFQVAVWNGRPDDLTRMGPLLNAKLEAVDLTALCRGGPPHFPEPVVTKGVGGAGNGPYVVDTLTEPYPNPWNVHTFFSGFDFFSDGRAAICTFHGDVWVVSGIGESVGKLTWRRYATGMFQPLGLKIVNDTVYVLGRDQITRLHDLNQDGEADYYEDFNNDVVVTPNYHEFALDLQTDSEGNFYFAKGSPWPPDVQSPHQGCLLKVSKDGSKMEVVATGFRAPNGMTVGPNDVITVGDNQGHWMPASKLNLIKPGGFYGMTPAAHRNLVFHRGGETFTTNPSDPRQRAGHHFKGWEDGDLLPEGYDEPICWLPMSMDNSSGGQVFVTSDKWGPFNGHLLFMSYGKCTLFDVMTEEVGGATQAGMVQFPLKFYSGVMRGRFNPRDGQLYVCGLKGWQTSATRDGGFYRVRYTGKPVRMAQELHVAQNGVAVTFTCPLDKKSAADPENYSVEQWNYQWTSNYGSPEFSVAHPGEKKHDTVEVKSVQLMSDRKTIFLEIPGLKPCDQMKIKFNINTADGAPISEEIYNTIHKLGPERNRS